MTVSLIVITFSVLLCSVQKRKVEWYGGRAGLQRRGREGCNYQLSQCVCTAWCTCTKEADDSGGGAFELDWSSSGVGASGRTEDDIVKATLC